MESPQLLSPVLSRQDKSYLYLVHSFIEEELSLLTSYDLTKERFLIYKQALNKILEYVQCYKGLLGSIKKEYELCIQALEKGQNETEKVRLELNKTISHPVTLLNLQKRKEELHLKIDLLNAINHELDEELDKQMNENKIFRPVHQKQIKQYAFLNFEKQREDSIANASKPLIPGLNIEQSTDLNFLSNLLYKFEYKLKNTNSTKNTNFSTKQRKQELQVLLALNPFLSRFLFLHGVVVLKESLLKKVLIRDELQIKNDALKRKVYLYKLAVDAAKEYYDGNSQYSSILDALTRSVINGSLVKNVKLDDETEQMGEHLLESEAEYILDYIDKFNELFENGEYRDAAYYAAASPRGVLRNVETMHRFKGVCNVDLGDSDPLLMYCCALLDSIDNKLTSPDEAMSLECIKIALAHEKIDLLTRWVAERRLHFSYVAAKLIEEYVEIKAKFTKKGLELALFMYNAIDSVLEAATCMAKLGRYTSMIEYLCQNHKTVHSNADTYLRILHGCPDVNFAIILVDSEKLKGMVKIEQAVSVLLDSSQPSNGLKFLKLQIDKLPTDYISEQDGEETRQKKEKLKESYLTLNKFAFLAENDGKMDEKTMNELRNSMEEFKSRIGDTSLNENLRHIIEDKAIVNQPKDKSSKGSSEPTIKSPSNSFKDFQNNLTGSEQMIDTIYDKSILETKTALGTDCISEKAEMSDSAVEHMDFYNNFSEIFDVEKKED